MAAITGIIIIFIVIGIVKEKNERAKDESDNDTSNDPAP